MTKKQETELGNLIKNARETKGYSQRFLAKTAGMDVAEISRIESGKRKKPNVLYLKGIAETLDLSMKQLMKYAGYTDVEIDFIYKGEESRSTKDYQNQIQKYEKFYFDVLDDIENRRKTTRSCRGIIANLIYTLESKDDISKDKIMEDLKEVMELSKSNLNKLDKEKYPEIDHNLFPKINFRTRNFVEDEKK